MPSQILHPTQKRLICYPLTLFYRRKRDITKRGGALLAFQSTQRIAGMKSLLTHQSLHMVSKNAGLASLTHSGSVRQKRHAVNPSLSLKRRKVTEDGKEEEAQLSSYLTAGTVSTVLFALAAVAVAAGLVWVTKSSRFSLLPYFSTPFCSAASDLQFAFVFCIACFVFCADLVDEGYLYELTRFALVP